MQALAKERCMPAGPSCRTRGIVTINRSSVRAASSRRSNRGRATDSNGHRRNNTSDDNGHWWINTKDNEEQQRSSTPDDNGHWWNNTKEDSEKQVSNTSDDNGHWWNNTKEDSDQRGNNNDNDNSQWWNRTSNGDTQTWSNDSDSGSQRQSTSSNDDHAREEGNEKRKHRSSWDAVEAGGGRGGGADYLYEVGASANYNTNVDTGQNLANLESHFAGNFLGKKSDIADGSLRRWDFRTFDNLVGDYYVAHKFLEKITMHVVKNYLTQMGCIDEKTKVPLILGVWGPKGMGKTFQTELALKKLGAEAVVMSAGELEHEWAGTPGKLIRERYKRASDMSKVRGKFTCLIINDIDAGLGHFANTQTTVNNQIVIGTLMNLCDDPTQVSTGEEWSERSVSVRRTPIIVTGNDFSKMFAPLIRDGRMDKFYWEPEHEDLVGILYQMYKDDGLSVDDMYKLLDRFKSQPLDFFGALRASTYDNQIRDWIEHDVLKNQITADDANMAELSRRLLKRADLPTFEPVHLTLDMLVREGERLEMEQEMVKNHNLSAEYMKLQKKAGGSILGLKG